MRNSIKIGAVAITGALALAACGSSSGGGSGSSSAPAGKTVVIGTDLPLQGSSKDSSDATNQAIQLYLDQIGNKVGDYTIQLKRTKSPSWVRTTQVVPRSSYRS